MMSTKPTILCVDDELNVVESMKLNLRRHYKVLTAQSGMEALQILQQHTEVAVVVSDMRMPEMDGAKLLAEVKSAAPNVVRMLLTGYSDIDAAMRAVNEGQIFRFLTKPCEPEHLLATLEAGVEQHRLITAEQVLLQRTLLGSVKALVEVMALSNPMALGRAVRIRNTVRKLAKAARLSQTWRLEFAAMLSQVGAVSLPDDTVRKLYDGDDLEADEYSRVVESMTTIRRIVGNIPRLEPVTSLLDELTVLVSGGRPTDASLEARLLKVAIDLDALEARGESLADTVRSMHEALDKYDSDVLDALEGLLQEPEQMQPAAVGVDDLVDGMVLCEDLKTLDGVLILPRGFAINESSREHIMNFAGQLREPIKVLSNAGPDLRSAQSA